MRVIFFFINTPLFFMQLFFFALLYGAFVPPAVDIQKAQAYGNTVLQISFTASQEYLLYGLVVAPALALLLGIFSRGEKKLDRKVIFSKKGFLSNLIVAVAMASIGLVSMGGRLPEFDRAIEILSRIYTENKTDANILLMLEREEEPSSFELRLTSSGDKGFDEIREDTYEHMCDPKQQKVSVGLPFDMEMLIVPRTEINRTVEEFASAHQKFKEQKPRNCEIYLAVKREMAEDAAAESWKNRRDECLKKRGNRALCNAITNQELGN